jgi:hypothetical protein
MCHAESELKDQVVESRWLSKNATDRDVAQLLHLV